MEPTSCEETQQQTDLITTGTTARSTTPCAVTPPCPIQHGHLQTPAELRSYTHNTDIPAQLIPVLGQEFNSYDDAFNFFNDYAKHVGFGIRKGQKNKKKRYLYCVHSGKYTSSVHDADRQRNKVTKRTDCKTMMLLKERDDGTCVVKDIVIEHNHRLLDSPSTLVFLHSHKTIDPTVKEYIKDLHKTNVKHVNIMSLLSWLSGGRDKLPFTDKD
uniref:FAR1 domain-containing protein n=1 Tax=Aegilops tauschii subsp. strangulata TaxID=200361 RepID=A0A453BGK4_AEGTS